MSNFRSVCEEGERISREEGFRVMQAEIASLHAEIARLRLTDAEREAVKYVCRNVLPDGSREGDDALHSLRMLLRRTQ